MYFYCFQGQAKTLCAEYLVYCGWESGEMEDVWECDSTKCCWFLEDVRNNRHWIIMLNNPTSNINLQKLAPKIQLTTNPHIKIPKLPQLLQISIPKLENKDTKIPNRVIKKM